MEQGTLLTVLCRAPAGDVKQFADALIPALGPIEVLRNRTGLVMLPMHEPAHGATFYLGEVLVAEAHVRLGTAEGYAACLGRDLQQALAVALLDAAVAAGLQREAILAFATAQAERQHQEERTLLQQVAATRVDLETF